MYDSKRRWLDWQGWQGLIHLFFIFYFLKKGLEPKRRLDPGNPANPAKFTFVQMCHRQDPLERGGEGPSWPQLARVMTRTLEPRALLIRFMY